MKNYLFALLISSLVCPIFAQTVENTNVYPSNLEENMYFEEFDAETNVIHGLNFMVLSDGNDSQYITPGFEVSLYLLPEGSSSADDLIIVKKYPLDGIYHFGSHEFENETVNLEEVAGISPGNYRLGVWVNSASDFAEDENDNATLFRQGVTITKATSGVSSESSKSTWDDDDDDDWDYDDWDDDDW